MEILKSICKDCKREFEHALEDTDKCFDCTMKEETTQCSHRNKDYYNHGYHCVCRDCGEEL